VELKRSAKGDFNWFPDRCVHLFDSPRLYARDYGEYQIVDVEIYKYCESVVLLQAQRNVVTCITGIPPCVTLLEWSDVIAFAHCTATSRAVEIGMVGELSLSPLL